MTVYGEVVALAKRDMMFTGSFVEVSVKIDGGGALALHVRPERAKAYALGDRVAIAVGTEPSVAVAAPAANPRRRSA